MTRVSSCSRQFQQASGRSGAVSVTPWASNSGEEEVSGSLSLQHHKRWHAPLAYRSFGGSVPVLRNYGCRPVRPSVALTFPQMRTVEAKEQVRALGVQDVGVMAEVHPVRLGGHDLRYGGPPRPYVAGLA